VINIRIGYSKYLQFTLSAEYTSFNTWIKHMFSACLQSETSEKVVDGYVEICVILLTLFHLRLGENYTYVG
jgi:hypothetical protein